MLILKFSVTSALDGKTAWSHRVIHLERPPQKHPPSSRHLHAPQLNFLSCMFLQTFRSGTLTQTSLYWCQFVTGGGATPRRSGFTICFEPFGLAPGDESLLSREIAFDRSIKVLLFVDGASGGFESRRLFFKVRTRRSHQESRESVETGIWCQWSHINMIYRQILKHGLVLYRFLCKVSLLFKK